MTQYLIFILAFLIAVVFVYVYGWNILVNKLAARGRTFAMVPEMTGLIVEKFRKMHRVFIAISAGPRFRELVAYVDSRNRRIWGFPDRDVEVEEKVNRFYGAHRIKIQKKYNIPDLDKPDTFPADNADAIKKRSARLEGAAARYRDSLEERIPYFLEAAKIPSNYQLPSGWTQPTPVPRHGYTLIARGSSFVYIGLIWAIYKVVEWFETRGEQEVFAKMTPDQQAVEQKKREKIPKHSVTLREQVHDFPSVNKKDVTAVEKIPNYDSSDPIGVASDLRLLTRAHDPFKVIYSIDFPISAIRALVLTHWRETISELSFAELLERTTEEVEQQESAAASKHELTKKVMEKLIPAILQVANTNLRLKLGIWQRKDEAFAKIDSLNLSNDKKQELKGKLETRTIKVKKLGKSGGSTEDFDLYVRRMNFVPWLEERYPEESLPADLIYHAWGIFLRDAFVTDLELADEADRKKLSLQVEAMFKRRERIILADAEQIEFEKQGLGLARKLEAQLQVLTGKDKVSLAEAENVLTQLTYYQETLKNLPKEGRQLFFQLPNLAEMFPKQNGGFEILRTIGRLLGDNPKLLEGLKNWVAGLAEKKEGA